MGMTSSSSALVKRTVVFSGDHHTGAGRYLQGSMAEQRCFARGFRKVHAGQLRLLVQSGRYRGFRGRPAAGTMMPA